MSSTPNPKVEWFFDKESQWHAHFKILRTIILDSGLAEELKWGHPCYVLGGSNVVLMHGFKNYCALLFMKGALFNDTEHILVQQTENVQSARQIRFTSIDQIIEMKDTIKAYLTESITVEKSGLKVEFKKSEEFTMPEEFQSKLDEIPALKEAFEALTPGRQRGYKLYFSSAKLSKTREERVEKCLDRILDGLGLED
jgi:uncharacterized protein YdeI (YjbR/CyaY-like superfamily)